MEYRALKGMSSLPRPAIATISLRLRRWYFRTALRLLFAEIRALGHHIRWILQIREVELRDGAEGVRLWMQSLPAGGPCTHDYIVYMQQISARFPSLSIFDRLLLTEAWKAGLESGDLFRTSQNQVESCDSPGFAQL